MSELKIFNHCQRTEKEKFSHISEKFIKFLLKFIIWQFCHYYFYFRKLQMKIQEQYHTRENHPEVRKESPLQIVTHVVTYLNI